MSAVSRDDFEDWLSEQQGEAIRRLPRRKVSLGEWLSLYSAALHALTPDEDDDEDDEYRDEDDGVPELDFGS